MGQGSTKDIGAELVQVRCEGRPDLVGVYSKRGQEKEILIFKSKGEKIGVQFNIDGVVRGVESGSPGDKAGLANCIGDTILNKEIIDLSLNDETVCLKLKEEDPSANYYPVWKKGNFHIYSTKEGKWMLTDSKEGITKSSGYAMTTLHSESPPTEIPEWHTYNRSKAQWEVDRSFAVWELTMPTFKIGQLVEFKPSVASQEDAYQPGIITATKTPEEVMQGAHQYEIEISGTDTRLEVDSCCIRAHSAYRGAGMHVTHSSSSLNMNGSVSSVTMVSSKTGESTVAAAAVAVAASVSPVEPEECEPERKSNDDEEEERC
eukprot:TRINITY_DN2669_c2_g2_i1.p1 TRINITY_DN2669_c2_g2~~TRINITY_DN2669_c2_g2_i1.p1  ORF type:complete len:318 (+),score=50.55 TRINITY_DN2669_c2_g2_i1:64-1017(+)